MTTFDWLLSACLALWTLCLQPISDEFQRETKLAQISPDSIAWCEHMELDSANVIFLMQRNINIKLQKTSKPPETGSLYLSEASARETVLPDLSPLRRLQFIVCRKTGQQPQNELLNASLKCLATRRHSARTSHVMFGAHVERPWRQKHAHHAVCCIYVDIHSDMSVLGSGNTHCCCCWTFSNS